MNADHYNDLITLSQEIYDQATEKLTNYLSARYCAVGNDTTEQQLEDYLFVTEEFRNLDCRGCVTSASALSRLVARGCRPFSAEKEPLAPFPGAPNPTPTIFLPLAVICSSPSAYFLGNALALLDPDTQEAEIKTFTDNLRRVIKYAQQIADIRNKPS